MAQIEESLRNILLADAAVAGIVVARIYPVRTPDNATFPCISYARVNSDRAHRLDGPGNLTFTLFQFDLWADRQLKGNPTAWMTANMPGVTGGAEICRRLARYIQTALDGYRGTVLGIDIQAILSENESQSWETDIEVYRLTQQWRVIHREG